MFDALHVVIELLLWCFYDCFCVIFFFFKQKTAYEMRISDWSSDVCSSDLKAHVAAKSVRRSAAINRASGDSSPRTRPANRAACATAFPAAPWSATAQTRSGRRRCRCAAPARGPGTRSRQAAARPSGHRKTAIRRETGRAPDRERVGQYVSISVGTVQLKKKTT